MTHCSRIQRTTLTALTVVISLKERKPAKRTMSYEENVAT